MDIVSEILSLLARTLLVYLPAMAANGAPVFLRRGRPIDMGRVFIDGRRVLGDGKTFEGLGLFLFFGTAVGAVYTSATGEPLYIVYGLLSGIGAALGDLLGAFIKRRIGLRRGEPAPVLDQTGFMVMATVVLRATGIDTATGLGIDLRVFVTGLLVILVAHKATNYGAYRLGLKEVPY